MGIKKTQKLVVFSHLELGKLREASEDLLGDEVDPAVLGSEVELPLEPGVGSDGEAGAVLVPGHHARLSQGCRGGARSVLRWRPEWVSIHLSVTEET